MKHGVNFPDTIFFAISGRITPWESQQNRKVTMQKDAIHGVWKHHSAQWAQVGSPLRPTEEDTRIMLMLSAPAFSINEDISSVVVLGVTPEVVQLPWPIHTHVVAYDHSTDMIASVWQPHFQNPSSVQQVRWQSMPLSDESVDLVIGDGCLSVLPCADDYRGVFAEVARVLKPPGRLVLRCFLRPEQSESIADVVTAVFSGKIGSFHTLKWRVAMAIKPDLEFSVAVADIHAAFESHFPDRQQLAFSTGWSREAINTIDAYKGTDVRYTFPTMSELKPLLLPFFDIVEVRHGSYELAERCHILSLKPRLHIP